MDQNLVNYIQKARDLGLSDSDIQKNLLNTGWDPAQVKEAFSQNLAAAQPASASPTAKPTPAPMQPAEPPKTLPPISVLSAEAEKPKPVPLPAAATAPGMPMPGQPAKKSWLKWVIISAAAIVILGGGGYFAYAYIYSNPTKIWDKFISSSKDNVYQTKITFSYADKNTLSADKQGMLGSFKLDNLKLTFDGSMYLDQTNTDNPKSSADVQYTFGSGNTSFSTGLQYRLVDNVFYLNVGDNPLLKAIMDNASQDKSYDWIKIDLNAAQAQMAEDASSTDMQLYREWYDPSVRKDLAKIWDGNKIVKVDRFVGREKIDGKNVLHYTNTIDKSALKDILGQYISRLAKTVTGENAPTDQDIQNAQIMVNSIVDKLTVKDFETWIGMSDARLYRVKLVTSAPSLISTINNTGDDLSLTQSGSDAKRLSDMRQMASALELYYNDAGGYPAAVNGKPINLTPNYIGMIPVAPAASGQCADFYNTYWYTPVGQPRVVNNVTVYDSFEYTFCLGSDTAGYAAGVGKLTPSGIQANIPCPAAADKCVNAANAALSEGDKIKQIVDKISFDAEFQIDATYSGYGQTMDVKAPDESYDFLNELAIARSKSRDARRLADVQQLSSALELYYNDYKAYPADLKAMSPNYIGIVPTAPTPQDGTCTADNNTYHYSTQGTGAYQITFCLGGDTSGYKAGLHTLSQNGIQ